MNRLFLVLFVLLFVSCNRENEELPAVVNDDFTIEVTEVTTGTIKATITPKDKDMIYVAQVCQISDSIEDVVENLFSDPDLTLSNIGVHIYLEYARDNNLDILEFITQCNVGGKGTIELERNMLQPGAQHCIVVLGFET